MILRNYFIKLVFEKEEGALARSLCKGYPLYTRLSSGVPFAFLSDVFSRGYIEMASS